LALQALQLCLTQVADSQDRGERTILSHIFISRTDILSRRSPSLPEALFDLTKRQTCPNNVHYNQWTTYYYEGTSSSGTTACGTQYNTAYMTAAISTDLESAIGGISNACSRQIIVVDQDTGNTVQLAIEDSNATGNLGVYALDITPTAYEALGGSLSGDDPGQRMITWYLTDGVQECF
jgi:hypothetical protein